MSEHEHYGDVSIYDILHTPGTAGEVDGFERMSLRYAPGRADRHVWLEPACGTGRYLRVAAARGRRVIGFDRNRAMLDYARHQLEAKGLARRARLLIADMETFDVGQRVAHFAFNTINTIRHLDSDESLTRHLDCMRKALVPGGIYAVGLSLASYGQETATEDVWEGARGRCRVRQVVQYLPPGRRDRRERVISHVSVQRPRGETHCTTSYDLRAYDAAQWRAALARSNVEVVGVVDEGGKDIEPVEPGYAIHLLRLS